MRTTIPPEGAAPPELSPRAPAPGTRLSQHYAGCFACGHDQTAGLHLAATVGDGPRIVASFTVTTAHQGAPGLAHGGVLATAVDESMGFLMFLVGEPAVTAHLEVDYRMPVPIGSRVTLHAEGIAREGRKIWTTVKGTLEDGRVAFSGSAIFMVVPIEHFTKAAPDAPIGDSILARYNP